MKAVVVTPGAPAQLALADVAEPAAERGEAVVRVRALSLNRGEVRRASMSAGGERPGWDLAGTVEHAAAGGAGPKVGTRVVGFLPTGAWAERVAVPVEALAELPESVSFAQAATLPVAGLTALVALARGGDVLGQSVLVTGATGGAGHFAVQLARAAGARVVAVIRRPEGEALVREAGAHEVVVDESGAAAERHGPYQLVIDGVGGAQLTNALALLAPNGVCVVYGATASGEASFDLRRFFGTGGTSIYGLILFHEVKREPAGLGLARLAGMIADGRLRPHIEVEAPWTEIGSVAQRLLDRGFAGKAVLHLA